MTIVMDVRSSMKATLLAIIILSVVTWLSHLYSCIKNFMESLPYVVSAIIAPKCLFIFSNIIVVYLVSESKLSRRRSKLMKTGDIAAANDEDMQQDIQKHEDIILTKVFLPTITGVSKQEQENKMAMVVDEEKDVQMLIVVPEKRETSVGKDGVRVNQCKEKVNRLLLQNIDELQEEEEEGGDLEFELGEDVSGDVQQERAMEEESEEWDLPTADELNRRVEDFIARFNMERQLEEARMPLCCY